VVHPERLIFLQNVSEQYQCMLHSLGIKPKHQCNIQTRLKWFFPYITCYCSLLTNQNKPHILGVYDVTQCNKQCAPITILVKVARCRCKQKVKKFLRQNVLQSVTPFPFRKVSPIREVGVCVSSCPTGRRHAIRNLHFFARISFVMSVRPRASDRLPLDGF